MASMREALLVGPRATICSTSPLQSAGTCTAFVPRAFRRAAIGRGAMALRNHQRKSRAHDARDDDAGTNAFV
jgi:hypothetical protein